MTEEEYEKLPQYRGVTYEDIGKRFKNALPYNGVGLILEPIPGDRIYSHGHPDVQIRQIEVKLIK